MRPRHDPGLTEADLQQVCRDAGVSASEQDALTQRWVAQVDDEAGAAALRLSLDAYRMRISRAVEKIRRAEDAYRRQQAEAAFYHPDSVLDDDRVQFAHDLCEAMRGTSSCPATPEFAADYYGFLTPALTPASVVGPADVLDGYQESWRVTGQWENMRAKEEDDD